MKESIQNLKIFLEHQKVETIGSLNRLLKMAEKTIELCEEQNIVEKPKTKDLERFLCAYTEAIKDGELKKPITAFNFNYYLECLLQEALTEWWED